LNFLICEGKHDTIFFEELIRNKLQMKCCPIQSEMGELQKTFRDFSDYYKTTYHWIVYKDNGKDEIKKIVLPRIIKDNHGRNNSIHLLVVLDQDFVDPDIILNTIHLKIIEILKPCNLPHFKSEICHENLCIKTLYTKNANHTLFFKFIMIPSSFEKKIVSKILEINAAEFTRIEKEKLNSDDPHESLKCISEKMRISKDEIIQQSVDHDWFVSETWYQQLEELLTRWNN
jgi:hypothetical protein